MSDYPISVYHFLMKNLGLTILLILLSSTIQAEEVCEQDTTPAAVEELLQFNCERINSASCAQNEPDPNALRNRILGQLAYVEKEQAKIQRHYEQAYKNTAWSQFFDYDARYKENNSSYVPQPLLDWFTMNGQAEGFTKEELKNSLVEKYVAFGQKNDCTPVIKHQYTHIEFPQRLKTRTEQELQRAIREIPDFEQKRDDFFKDYNSRSLERGSYCDKSRALQPRFHYTHLIHQPCSGNLSGFFKDNEWNSSSLDQLMDGEEASSVVNCIRERIRNGGTIHHITVSSSASALNNTGEAAKKFCKKGFRGLSEARADAARNRILPQLFARAGSPDFDFDSHVQTKTFGGNGDGTSGPCPYKLVNGVEVLKDEYRTAEGKKELEDAKYVRIQVTFNESKTPHPDTGSYYHNRYVCRNIRFQCAPVN